MIERAKDKLNFEKQRLLALQNPNHADTFEKFINFNEEQPQIDQETQKSIYAYEGGYLEDETPTLNKCRVCKIFIDTETKFEKDLLNLCKKCSDDYVSGLCGDAEKGSKKRVHKVLQKIEGASTQKKASTKKVKIRESSNESLRPD